jgi:CheY-like chemotaxis protein
MNGRFLYVEDDALSREIMQMLMESLGHEITIFEDSTDFIARVEALSLKPHTIFLDIHMEPQNGFAMLEMLRAHPDYQNATVIAVTASVMNEEIARLRTSGFDGAIGKPLDFDQFPALLERLMSGDEVWYVS